MVPHVSLVKNPPANTKIWVQSVGQKYPLEKEMATHSIYCLLENPIAEEFGGLQSIESQELDTTE